VNHPASYISDNLLTATALAFAAGIVASPFVALSHVSALLAYTVLVCSLLLLIFLHLWQRPKTIYYLLIPMFMAIGCYHGYVHLQPPLDKNHIYHKVSVESDAVLIGTMSTMVGFDGRLSQVTIDARSIRMGKDAAMVPTDGKILLSLQGPWPGDISPGDTLAIRTELKHPSSFQTPGVFDYAQYLARKNLWITGFVRSPLFIHKLKENHSFLHTLRYLPEKLRGEIGRQIDAAVPADRSGLYRAILIGDRSRIDEDTLELFKDSGTMHILAISGLHMAIIGTLLYTGLLWIFSRSENLLLRFTLKKWAAFFSLPILLCYGLLAGMNTPVFRAVIMCSIVIIAICTNRRKSPAPLVAAAAIFILTVDPLQIFTVSFQLSFAAIISILFLWPVLRKLISNADEPSLSVSLCRRGCNWLLAGFAVSLVASLATAPIALYAFNRFSVIGPLANLIIEPLVCLWSLAAGFVAIPFLFIHPETGTFFLQVGALGLGAALQAATLFSSLSFSTIWLPTPSLWLISIYYGALLVFACSKPAIERRSLLSVAILAICILLFFHPPHHYWPNSGRSLRITYLDVGQGTATLIDYPSGKKVLIDGGGSSFTKTSIGQRVIAPFLWQRGIQVIDAVVITHPDADHYNGLDFIIEHFVPEVLWVREKSGHDEMYQRLLQLAEKRGVTVSVPKEGDFFLQGSESLQCLADTAAWGEIGGDSASREGGNSGLVLKACADQLCVLFPGDIGRAEEHSLVAKGYKLQADVLLAAHHGSITSNSKRFLSAVSPKYLLVSAGRSTKRNFPHEGLASECASLGINLFSTSLQGTLEIISQQDGYRLYGYERKNDNPLSANHPVLLAERKITPR
jgi:competence protein ComEC